MEEGRSSLKFLTSELTGKSNLERLGIDGRDNIRMDLKEIGINMRN